MADSVQGQMRQMIVEGLTPAEVTEAVMAELPRRWKDFARPFVLRLARGIEGKIVNRRMKRAMSGRRGSRHQEAAVIRLDGTVYKLPDGQRIVWADWGPDEFDAKIAWLRKQVGSLVDHLNVLEAARDLCLEKGVDRIGDIPGWVDQVRERVEHNPAWSTPWPRAGEGDASGEAEAA